MLPLAGKRCVITGGSRGIGLAIAQHFASEGASCTIVGRNAETLQKATASLKVNGLQQTHEARPFDVSVADAWLELVGDKKGENIDVLVNAAGITQNSFLFKTKIPDINNIITTNLNSTIFGCRTVIPKMMKQNSGCIINVSSLMATHGGRGASVYAATKAGIVGLTRSLAWEVGRFGIRANVLLPGYIQTGMTKAMDEKGELSALIPMGRLGLAEEVAQAAAFLAKNPYAHNCVLNIDGGLSAT